ncbi:hypothetical protein ACP70R_045747 [Stipagrostis hirtigluma subsp. patula]
MNMDRYTGFVLTFLFLQSFCYAKGASQAVKNTLNATSLGRNKNPRLGGETSRKDITIPRPTMVNCFAGLTNRSDHVFGIYANMSAWGHEQTKSDAYSETVIQISNDQGAEYNAIRAGLHTLPSLYHDTKLHLFAQWTTDRDWKTGCYNMDCPGFVPFDNTHPEIPLPGMVFEALSYSQTDSSIILQIVKPTNALASAATGGCTGWSAPCGSRWATRRRRSSRPCPCPGTRQRRRGTAPSATRAAARGDDLPAMGSGHGPGEGYTRAAYFADISLMDSTAYPVDGSLRNVAPMVNNERCYKLAMDAGNDPPYRFFYGGPVCGQAM